MEEPEQDGNILREGDEGINDETPINLAASLQDLTKFYRERQEIVVSDLSPPGLWNQYGAPDIPLIVRRQLGEQLYPIGPTLSWFLRVGIWSENNRTWRDPWYNARPHDGFVPLSVVREWLFDKRPNQATQKSTILSDHLEKDVLFADFESLKVLVRYSEKGRYQMLINTVSYTHLTLPTILRV